MDRHGGGKRPGESEGRYSRMASRWSDSPIDTPHQVRQSVGYFRGGPGRHGGYSERHHPYRGGPPRDYSLGGGRGSGFQPGPGGYNSGFNGGDDQQFHIGNGGLMRGNGRDGGRDDGRDGEFLGAGRREYPKNNDGSKITKLFIGSVPRTATEQEARDCSQASLGEVMDCIQSLRKGSNSWRLLWTLQGGIAGHLWQERNKRWRAGESRTRERAAEAILKDCKVCFVPKSNPPDMGALETTTMQQ